MCSCNTILSSYCPRNTIV